MRNTVLSDRGSPRRILWGCLGVLAVLPFVVGQGCAQPIAPDTTPEAQGVRGRPRDCARRRHFCGPTVGRYYMRNAGGDYSLSGCSARTVNRTGENPRSRFTRDHSSSPKQP